MRKDGIIATFPKYSKQEVSNMVFRYYFNFERDSFGYLMLKLPSKIRLFSHFIELIATEDRANEFIQIIDEVKEGKHEEYEIFFNAPTVLIRPEITSVSLSDRLDEDAPPDQYIETDQFRELILIWKEKLPVRFIDKDTKH